MKIINKTKGIKMTKKQKRIYDAVLTGRPNLEVKIQPKKESK